MDIWTNHDVPIEKQFGAWQERLGIGRNPARATRLSGLEDPFPARLGLAHVGNHDLLSVHAPAHRVELRARDAAVGRGYFALSMTAPAALHTGGQTVSLPPGSLCLIDPRGDEVLESAVAIDYHALSVPRWRLDAHIAARQWPNSAVALRADHPVGSLATSYVGALVQNGQELSIGDAEAAMDTLCRLVALALRGEQPPSKRSNAVRAARLMRVKRTVTARLSDPALSPAALAAELGMSVRNLHLLFQDSAETFSEFVMRRRLEACRDDLLARDDTARSITDIAFAHGFTNLTTFYRAFRAAFGMTPLEMRAAGMSQG